MRNIVAMACLVAVTLTGCATRPVELVPPGVDRAELADAIARRGEGRPLEAGDPLTDPPPRPDTPLEKAFEYTVVYPLGAVAVAGLCLLVAAAYVAPYALQGLARSGGAGLR